jgi:hypothetical protein
MHSNDDSASVPVQFEPLEGRRLLSVSLTGITGTSAVAGTPDNTGVRAEKATLTAQGVSASAGDKVTSVTYFLDTDHSGTLNAGDKIIGKSSNSGKNFAVTTTIKSSTALGTLTISAVAKGKQGASDVSTVVTQDITIVDDPPTIKKLTAAPKKVAAGKTLTLIANNVKDKDGTVSSVEFFQDKNGNGQIDAGDTDLGAGTKSGNNWKFDASSVITGAASGDTFTFLAQATDNDASTSSDTSPPSVTVTIK